MSDFSALEPWLCFLDQHSEPDSQDIESLDYAVQGGIEKLGFLFRLGDELVLNDLAEEIAGFIDAYLGATPLSPERSEYWDSNIEAVRGIEESEIVIEIGALIGESAVEHGWSWARTPEFGLVVRMASGFAFRPFDLVRDLLARKVTPESIRLVFEGLVLS